MSTRFVTGTIGAGIGFALGGPSGAQWGWAIGSAAGSVIDPQVIKGPSIGDISQQTSSEGGPIPIIFGMSPPIAGNVIATSEPRIAKKKESGKGGPKVETEYVYRTYAMGVCEGPIGGFLRVWRNGKKVYDALDVEFNTPRDVSIFGTLQTRNEKFLEKARFFLGTYDQNASPDLESVFGAGTTPSYRGLAYMVMDDEDVTDMRGVIPQWQFQVSEDEVPIPGAGPLLTLPTPFGYLDSPSEVEIGATTNQDSGTFYVVLGIGTQLVGVTAAQIMAGERANGDAALFAQDGSISDENPSLSITGLSASTTYRYASVQQNTNGTSNIVKGAFRTADPPPPPASEVFTTSGTWSKPDNLDYIEVVCIGAGAGGAAGGKKGTYVGTGADPRPYGGGGGAYIKVRIAASALPSAVDVVVGAKGVGGVGKNVTSGGSSGTTINRGTAGGYSGFEVTGDATRRIRANGGPQANDGNSYVNGAAYSSAWPSGLTVLTASQGRLYQIFGDTNPIGGSSANPWGAGGGAYAGTKLVNDYVYAANGIDGAPDAPGGAGGTSASSPAAIGSDGSAGSTEIPGGGGGSGGAGTDVSGGKGGNGGFPGGGGGAGGNCDATTGGAAYGGNGGDGADGVVVVTPYYL